MKTRTITLVFAPSQRAFLDWVKSQEYRPTCRWVSKPEDIEGYCLFDNISIALVFLHECWKMPNWPEIKGAINRILP